MKTGTFLDMDMAQLGTALRDGWHWWTGELAEMMPASLRGRGAKAQRIAGLVAFAEPDGSINLDGMAAEMAPDRAVSATLLVARDRALIRTVSLPPLRRADLRKLVALDLDRLMPFPAGEAWSDVAETGDTLANGQVQAQIAAMPKAELLATYQAAADYGLRPRALGIATHDGGALDFDFLPAMIADGAVPPAAGARRWWILVALLFAANVGLIVWKDVRRNDEIQALVDAQQPLVNAARKLTQNMTGEDKVRAELLEARRTGNAVGALALITRAMPKGSWVQRYSWTKETVRLSGFKQPGSDVMAALRKTNAFASVRASTSDVAAEAGTGQPFDVTAEWAAP